MTLDPVRRTILLGAVLIVCAALMRPPGQSEGMPQDQFWSQKLLWRGQFDLVLAGDSRTYRGISPERMQQTLQGRRIANFGFSLAGLTRDYVEAAAQVLDPASPRRSLVLGVTSHSLTPNAAGNDPVLTAWRDKQLRMGKRFFPKAYDNEYYSLRKQNPIDTRLQVLFGRFLHWFRPYDLQSLQHLLRKEPIPFHEVFHPDGFVSSVAERVDDTGTRERITALFAGNQVSRPIVDDLLATVKDLRARGIAVYGLIPPSSKALRDLEIGLGQFDEAAFIRDFKAAGGRWIEPARGDYVAYDGLHLCERSALDLSEELAGAIAAMEASDPPR